MLVANIGRSSRTEIAMGRPPYCAMIQERNEDGSLSYVAHRYGRTRKEAAKIAEDYINRLDGGLVQACASQLK